MVETKTISVPPVTKALDATKKIVRGHQATMKLLGTTNKLCKMLPFSKPPTESSGTWFLSQYDNLDMKLLGNKQTVQNASFFQNHLLSPRVHGFYLNTITWI